MPFPPTEALPKSLCGGCRHYPAYHYGSDGACKAWDPDAANSACGCKSWERPKAPRKYRAHLYSVFGLEKGSTVQIGGRDYRVVSIAPGKVSHSSEVIVEEIL